MNCNNFYDNYNNNNNSSYLISKQYHLNKSNEIKQFSTNEYTSVYSQPFNSNTIQDFSLLNEGNGLHGSATFLTSPVMPQHNQSIDLMSQNNKSNVNDLSMPLKTDISKANLDQSKCFF